MPPPGWYADRVPGRQRWWDGQQWTADTRPDPAFDPPAPEPATDVDETEAWWDVTAEDTTPGDDGDDGDDEVVDEAAGEPGGLIDDDEAALISSIVDDDPIVDHVDDDTGDERAAMTFAEFTSGDTGGQTVDDDIEVGLEPDENPDVDTVAGDPAHRGPMTFEEFIADHHLDDDPIPLTAAGDDSGDGSGDDEEFDPIDSLLAEVPTEDLDEVAPLDLGAVADAVEAPSSDEAAGVQGSVEEQPIEDLDEVAEPHESGVVDVPADDPLAAFLAQPADTVADAVEAAEPAAPSADALPWEQPAEPMWDAPVEPAAGGEMPLSSADLDPNDPRYLQVLREEARRAEAIRERGGVVDADFDGVDAEAPAAAHSDADDALARYAAQAAESADRSIPLHLQNLGVVEPKHGVAAPKNWDEDWDESDIDFLLPPDPSESGGGIGGILTDIRETLFSAGVKERWREDMTFRMTVYVVLAVVFTLVMSQMPAMLGIGA